MKKTVLIHFIVCFALAGKIIGQNYLYNTHQFGLQSTLLGGATTSGNNDLSMAYYNPAALHLAEPKANISFIAPRFDNYGFDKYFGKNEAENSRIKLGFSPTFASYKFNVNDRINLIVVTVRQSDWNNEVDVQNVFESEEGREEQIFKYRYKGNDRWVGTGGSFKINKNIAIGLSQFASTARFNYDYFLSNSTFVTSSEEPVSHFEDRLLSEYTNKLSFVTKLGLHLQFPNHNIGLVIKTPHYLRLLKGGTYEREQFRLEQGQVDFGSVIDFDLNPNIRTPWEFNLGYAVSFKDGSKIWLNAAYYPAVSDYDMVTIRTIDGREVIWRNGGKQVTNFAVGYSKTIRPDFEIIGSYRGNTLAYQNRPEEPGVARIFILDDNRNHVSIGSKFKLFNNMILLGIDWSFARYDSEDLFIGFPGINELNTTPADFSYNSFTLLCTYGFLFNRDI